ncbi:hypothetical protein Ccrd_011579 [Cynara cardunculus var. scolymus]|uniref:Uncharacterized protein n=1 Tax=Cynara cardunculus var. scolymus TaxID=59895 RepID=A0A118K641_CYNCS|nr:hypothetical protein Ccrd_011579 [Cynara cardunculus var. scolymus]
MDSTETRFLFKYQPQLGVLEKAYLPQGMMEVRLARQVLDLMAVEHLWIALNGMMVDRPASASWPVKSTNTATFPNIDPLRPYPVLGPAKKEPKSVTETKRNHGSVLRAILQAKVSNAIASIYGRMGGFVGPVPMTGLLPGGSEPSMRYHGSTLIDFGFTND